MPLLPWKDAGTGNDRHLGDAMGPGPHGGGSATLVLSIHFLPGLSALQTSLPPVPGMKSRSLGLIQIRAAQLQR